jgi:hypothetical protein
MPELDFLDQTLVTRSTAKTAARSIRRVPARCRRVGVIFKMPLNKKVFDVQISY